MDSMTRKKRNDRNHVIYQITHPDSGNFYIGLTVAQGRAFLKSVKIRFQKHVSCASRQDKDWKFSDFIRANYNSQYTYEVIEIVRGRKAAHARERALIAEFAPTLNTK